MKQKNSNVNKSQKQTVNNGMRLTNTLNRLTEICDNYFKDVKYVKENSNKYIIQDNREQDLITINIAKNNYYEYELSQKFIKGFLAANFISMGDQSNVLMFKKYRPGIANQILAEVNGNEYLCNPINYRNELHNHYQLAIDSLSVIAMYFKVVTLPIIDINDAKATTKQITALIFTTTNKEYAIQVNNVNDKAIQGLIVKTLLKDMKQSADLGSLLKDMENSLDFESQGIPSSFLG